MPCFTIWKEYVYVMQEGVPDLTDYLASFIGAAAHIPGKLADVQGFLSGKSIAMLHCISGLLSSLQVVGMWTSWCERQGTAGCAGYCS